jgi:hypothetical protein
MHWDAHKGRWVSAEVAGLVNLPTGDAVSPSRRRAVSPGRSALHGTSIGHSATAAGMAAVAARRRAAPPPDDTASTQVDDIDLPGWLVLQRTTNTGRSYKVRPTTANGCGWTWAARACTPPASPHCLPGLAPPTPNHHLTPRSPSFPPSPRSTTVRTANTPSPSDRQSVSPRESLSMRRSSPSRASRHPGEGQA